MIELSRRPLQDTGAQVLAYGTKDTGEMGGGAAREILLAAGQEVREALRAELARTDRSIGTTVFTPAFKLAERGALALGHIVSIRKNTSQGAWCPEPERLADGVRACLEKACALQVSSVALSALGTGEGRVDPDHCARLMLGAARAFGGSLKVTLALPNERDYQAFLRVLGNR